MIPDAAPIVKGASSTTAADFVITSNDLRFGGAERQRVTLANGLVARGHSVELRLVQPQAAGELLTQLDDSVRLTSGAWFTTSPRGGANTVLVTGSTQTEVAVGLQYTLRNARRRPWVVAHHHGAYPDRPTFPRQLPPQFRAATGAIYLAESHRAGLFEYQRLDNGRYWVIPNGSNPPANRARAFSGDEVRIISVGRLVATKRIEVVIEALSRLTSLNWHFDVYGDGPERANLENAIPVDLADRIQLHGWTSDVDSALATSDLFVLPSLLEAQPMVILEAMAAGVAIASSAVGAVPDMLQDDAGVLVMPSDVESWVTALHELLTDHGHRRRLADAGVTRARTVYTVERMIQGYETMRVEALA